MTRKVFQINGREISNKYPPYIIAELSGNHNGSISRAKEIISVAKKTGVDAIKIQSYTPDTMTIKSDNKDFFIKQGLWKNRSLYDLYDEAHTPFHWHKKLFDHAKKIGITIFSSPFDESAVDLLESLDVPAYKVASFEIVDLPLIKYIAKKRKPMLISTGMANLDEIAQSVEIAKSSGCKDLLLFHCISSYPTTLKESRISAIKLLKKEFKVEVGLSDHTLGNMASIIATSFGASAIEKHFTLKRSDGGVDSEFSLEPHEMTNLVKDTIKAHNAISDESKMRSSSEKENMVFRRSIYFVDDVKKGEKFTKSNIRRIRPGYGLNCSFYPKLIGSICLKNAKKGDRVTKKHFMSSH